MTIGIIIGVFVLVFFASILNFCLVLGQKPFPKPNPPTTTGGKDSFEAIDLEASRKRYHVEFAFIGFEVLVASLAVMLWVKLLPQFHLPPWQSYAASILPAMALGALLWHQVSVRLTEKHLAESLEGHILRIDPQGIKVGIGFIYDPIAQPFLGGAIRKRLRRENRPFMHWRWDEIKQFVIEPKRGRAAFSILEPNYYRLNVSTELLHVSILRKPFIEREQELVNVVGRYLGDRFKIDYV